VTSSAATRARPAPYKGLAPFTEADAEFFFGREREGDAIIASLKARRLTLLYGESGVGKSSLLRAGVASRLRGLARRSFNAIQTPEFVPVIMSSWRDDPISGLITCIGDAIAEFVPGEAPALRQLDEAIRLDAARADAYLLVILDQFEDYFLYHPDEAGPETFAVEFPRTLNQAGLPASFLISIREDALAKLDRFKREVPKLFDSALRIRHLDQASARAAMVKPVERYNTLVEAEDRMEIEPALVDAVIAQRVSTNQALREQSGRGAVRENSSTRLEQVEIEAPYLQLVMTRLWDEELASGSQTMHLTTLTRLGGAKEIVRTHLDTAMGHLSSRERETATDIFHYLVTPSGAKIVHSAPDLAKYSGHSDADVLALLEKLAAGDARIVRPVPSPPGESGPPRFEIYHDLLAAPILDWRSRQEHLRLERAKQRAEQEARSERKRARIFKSLAVGVAVLLVGAIALFAYALHQRSNAIDVAHTAQSQRVASEATGNGDLELASLRALEAYRIAKTVDARSAILAVADSHERGAPLSGHRNFVESVAFSPNGTTVASGSRDDTIRLWNVATHKQLGAPLNAHAQVVQVAFSPDGRTLASAGEDQTIRFWDLVTHSERGAPITGGGIVHSIAFSPDGTTLASGGEDRTIRFWDVVTGRQLQSPLVGHAGAVLSVTYNPNGKTLASASSDKTVRLWDLASRQQLGTLVGHTDAVYSVAFSPNGRTLASGSRDKTIRLWNVATLSQLGPPLIGHTGPVRSVAFAPDSKTLASAGDDQTIRLWNLASDQQVGLPLTGHTGPVFSVAISPDGTALVSGGRDATVRLWDVASPRQLGPPFIDGADAVNAVAFGPGRDLLVSGSSDGTVRLWDLASHRQLEQFVAGHVPIWSVAFSPNGRLLAAGGRDGTVRLWDIASHRQLDPSLTAGPSSVNTVAFSPDGRTLAAGGKDGMVTLWDTASHRRLRSLPGHGGSVLSVAFSPDGKRLAWGSLDNTIRLWNLADHQLEPPLTGDTDAVFSVKFSPDGTTLASASRDGTVRLWDLATYHQRGPSLAGHSDAVLSVAFSPDGTTLASGSRDATVRLWDVASGRELGLPLTGHTASVMSVAFSPDGRTVASGSNDHTIRLWTDAPIDDYIHQLCNYIDPRQAEDLWRQAEPSIAYRQAC
jgi:WD40 repeat protein